jgi:tetratricopeptide (TPR) repeat protein
MNVLINAARAVVFAGAVGALSALALAGEISDKPAASRDFEWSEPARDFDWSDATDPRLARARKSIDVEDWTGAARILVGVVAESPENADAYSYLGLVRRKLGDPDQALIYYRHALYLDPYNRSAIEYLGELYLDLNELPKAEQQLEALAQICGVACEEYRDLNEQVRRFKAGQPRG